MNKEDLILANDLNKLINQTDVAIEELECWINKSDQHSGGIYGNDKNYNLCICEFSDGSGAKVTLNRYIGNTKILHIILDELKNQLREYKERFEKI